ncbi:MAG: hypothetical protein KDA85_08525 [Planctomycetaceae bacterium]|nr:hypothetical protein [Planctomycetaceae bacterium]
MKVICAILMIISVVVVVAGLVSLDLGLIFLGLIGLLTSKITGVVLNLPERISAIESQLQQIRSIQAELVDEQLVSVSNTPISDEQALSLLSSE